MADYEMRISVGRVALVAKLLPNATARAIWNALPIDGRANLWGDELYFSTPVELAEEQAQEVVEVGDVAYWPPGNAVCIFWGRTPASHADEPRAASPVNVFGRIAASADRLASIKSGTPVRLERV